MDTSSTPQSYTVELVNNFVKKDLRNRLGDAIHLGMEFALERDRFNQYDLFAVKVFWDEHDGQHDTTGTPQFIGWLPRTISQYVGQWMDAGWTFTCTVDAIDYEKGKHLLALSPAGKGAPQPAPEIYKQPALLERLLADDDKDIPF